MKYNRLLLIFMLIASICGAALAILPVKVLDKHFTWPEQQTQSQSTASVSAPLSALTPQNLSIDIPEAPLLAHNKGYFLSTIPPNSLLSNTAGLLVNSFGNHISVISRGVQVFDIALKDIVKYPDSYLHIDTHTGGIYVKLTKSPWNSQRYAQKYNQIFGPELKPQVAGIFTQLNNTQLRGVHAYIQIDNRFDIIPTLIKRIAIIGSILGILVSLICIALRQKIIYAEDLSDQASSLALRRFMQWGLFMQRGFNVISKARAIFSRMRLIDSAVIIILILWWLLGPGGDGDGIIYSEALNAHGHDTYIEYYRYFGISLAPYAWYVHALGLWSLLSVNPLFMHLPQCLMGILCWLLIHHKVIPQLRKTTLHPLSLCCGAAIFVSLWMCLDSGLRPEPVIALGLILSWICFERAISQKNLLYLWWGFFFAFLILTTAVTGIVACAVIFAFARPILRLFIDQYRNQCSTEMRDEITPTRGRKVLSICVLVTPLILAFTAVWDLEFYHQTLATILEAIRVKYYIGPSTPWTSEYLRYFFLAAGADTSLALRIPFLIFLLCLLMSFYLLIRRRVNDSLIVPTTMRIMTVVFLSAILLSFTPNKWLDEFGILSSFAAIITIIGIELAIQPTQMTTRNALVFLIAILFCLSYASAAKNTWPNYADLGIPWCNIKPILFGKPIAVWGLDVTILVALIALYMHYKVVLTQQTRSRVTHEPRRSAKPTHFRILPLTIALPTALVLALLVAFNLSIFVKATFSRAATYTMSKSNLVNFLGHHCALGENIMVEPHPNDDILSPWENISQTQALQGNDPQNIGFSPNGIPQYLTDMVSIIHQGHSYTAAPGQVTYLSMGHYPGTNGGIGPVGINGSTARLPFGLDNHKVPLLGSYDFPSTARLTTAWYRLPAYNPQRPLLVIAMAGAIQSWDRYGGSNYGQNVEIEFGIAHPGQKLQSLGMVPPIDAALGRVWRDLRVDLRTEKTANVVRIHIIDTNLRNDQWVAVTPPRLPRLETIDAIVGKRIKVFKDLAIAADYPCIHSVSNYGGIWQMPEWRITPPRKEMGASSASWQKAADGGPLGIITALDAQNTLPSYMQGDLYEDWGALIKLSPLMPSRPAQINTRLVTQWGFTRSGPIRAFGGNDVTGI